MSLLNVNYFWIHLGKTSKLKSDIRKDFYICSILDTENHKHTIFKILIKSKSSSDQDLSYIFIKIRFKTKNIRRMTNFKYLAKDDSNETSRKILENKLHVFLKTEYNLKDNYQGFLIYYSFKYI